MCRRISVSATQLLSSYMFINTGEANINVARIFQKLVAMAKI